MAMYYSVGALWAYYIYWCFGNVFFGPGKMPGIEDVWNQIQVEPHAAAPSSADQKTEPWTAADGGVADACPRIGRARYCKGFRGFSCFAFALACKAAGL